MGGRCFDSKGAHRPNFNGDRRGRDSAAVRCVAGPLFELRLVGGAAGEGEAFASCCVAVYIAQIRNNGSNDQET